MRADNLTPQQLAAASSFLDLTRLSDRPEPHDTVTMQYHSLVRLLAWYGAIRFKSGHLSIGTETEPATAMEVETAEV